MRATHRRAGLVAVLIALALGAVACSNDGPPPVASSGPSGSITVLAAASLTGPFKSLGAKFEQAHPGTRIEFSFAGSPALVAQIQQGAPADLFASADQANMQKLVNGLLVAEPPRVFARNRLEIVVAAGNPKHITGLSDLARSGLVVVLCGETVPCGRYAAQALDRAGVKVTPASQEPDVKAVVSKVALGEADAGIVYVTDVRAAGSQVAGVEIPAAQNVVASYPIAVLKDATNPTLARAFIDFLFSSYAQQALAGYGFAGP